ncbi:MAG: ABC transporter permease [Acidimicrobiales bacterium]
MSTSPMAARVERAAFVVIPALFAVGLLAAGVLPVPVIVLSVPFLVVMARKPVLRRLAFRNATRRPRETVLILLGALLGTAIITGSAIVGDTLGSSIRRSAYTQLGPIDEVVRADDSGHADQLKLSLAALPPSDVDGLMSFALAGAAVATPGDQPRAEPNAQLVEIDFAEAAAFGHDQSLTGISGPSPSGQEAVIGADLATALSVGPGDTVDVYAYRQKLTFTVAREVPRVGVAGISFGFGSRSLNLFVPPGTLARLATVADVTTAPPQAFVAISNVGGVIGGADRTDAVMPQIEAILGADSGRAQPAKQRLLEAADRQGEQFTQLFTSIGFFSVIAGILLLVSIFVMLAEERKTELGMLRAVGLKRAGLVGTFSLEGWLYSLGSAALGTIAGLGVGRAIVAVTANIFAGDSDGFGLELQYAASLESIRSGFLIGFTMSLITVVVTSLWISRMNVIRAIRDLPNPIVERQRFVWVIVGSVAVVLIGIPMTLNGLSNSAPASILIGPGVIGLGAAPIFRRLMPKRLAYTITSGFVLLWAIFAFDIAGDAFDNPDISLFVVDGVLLTVSAVLLISQHQELIGRVLRRLGGGAKNMSLRLGLAYPLARAFRTSIILMTFALVMFTLTSITLFSGVFGSQIDQFTADSSGGFDIRVESNSSNPIPADQVAATAGVTTVASLSTVGAEFRLPTSSAANQREYSFWGLAGIDDLFVKTGPPALEKRAPRFATDADAYAELLTDPKAVIVSDFFLQEGGGPPEGRLKIGDPVDVRDPTTGTTRSLEVVAISRPSFGGGRTGSPVFMSATAVRDIVGDRAVPNVLFVATEPGVNAQDLAERLNGEYLANGADAASFRSLVGEGLAQQQAFFRLMQGYLSLGLIVGVAGLGVVMVRAVRERRREVGVLRSLGFESKQVRRAFVAESAFVALEGIGLGAVLALISTWRLMNSGAFGEGLVFNVPVLQVLLVVTLAFVATLIATAAPAQQASRIKPAVALRIAD